jgi:hypothetical protein
MGILSHLSLRTAAPSCTKIVCPPKQARLGVACVFCSTLSVTLSLAIGQVCTVAGNDL